MPASLYLRAMAIANTSPRLRRNIIWTLARIDNPAAKMTVHDFLLDPDETVRQAAIHVTGLWRDKSAPALIDLLQSPSAHNRRAAAEALGRSGNKAAVPALLKAVGQAGDRILEHSLTYALIEIDDPQATRAGLSSDNPQVIKAAMVALDQMDDGGLDPNFVAGLLTSSQPGLKETAAWIVGRHHDWADALADIFGERLSLIELPPGDRAELERQLGRFAQAVPIQRLLAARLRDAFAPEVTRRSSLQAMAWSNLKSTTLPQEWIDAIGGVLDRDSSTSDLVVPAVATLRALPVAKEKARNLPGRLLRIASDAKNATDLRLAALAAVPGGLVEPDQKLFAFLISQLDRERMVAYRTTAADVLARARLSTEQLVQLAYSLRTAGPLEVDRLLSAFDQSADESWA